jgi:DHA1 family inner membrane transport protein
VTTTAPQVLATSRAERADPSAARIIVALTAASFLGVLNTLALGPFFPAIARDLGTSVPLLGQIAGGVALLAACAGLVIGPLADRYGHRRLLFLGMAILAATTLGTALAPSYGALLAVRLLGALSGPILGGVSLAAAANCFEGPARQRAIAWTSAGLSGVGIAGFPLLTAIGGAWGWRAAFVALALAALGGAALLHAVLPRTAARSASRPTPRAILAASALRATCWLGIITYTGAYWAERHGLTAAQTGLVYMLACGGYLLGSLAAGGRLGRCPLRPIFAATTALTGLLLGAAHALPLGTVAAVALLGGAALTYGIGWVALVMLLAGESPAGRATTLVLNGALINAGAAGGSALGGLLLIVGGYAALGAGLGVCAIASAGLALAGRARRGEARSRPCRASVGGNPHESQASPGTVLNHRP